jgi:threonine/homoserine/homoserine lactone efflux protein
MTDLIALALATAVLVMIPGPNVALIVANSLRYGLREGMLTVFGTTLGVALQLALVVVGVAAAVEFAAEALSWIRWAGVVYLVYLGIRAWREPASSLDAVEAQPTVFWRACMVAAVNPKTLLFNAAFLPQFLPAGAGTLDLILTVGVFLLVLLVGDMLWAGFADSARRLLHRYGRFRNRMTGAFLVAAGIGLALSRRSP